MKTSYKKYISKIILITQVEITMLLYFYLLQLLCETRSIRYIIGFFLTEPIFVYIIYPIIMLCMMYFIVNSSPEISIWGKILLLVLGVAFACFLFAPVNEYYIDYFTENGFSWFIYKGNWCN